MSKYTVTLIDILTVALFIAWPEGVLVGFIIFFAYVGLFLAYLTLGVSVFRLTAQLLGTAERSWPTAKEWLQGLVRRVRAYRQQRNLLRLENWKNVSI